VPQAPPPPPTATLGVPEQPGAVPGAPTQDGTAAPVPGAPAAEAGAAQPQAAPTATDPAATQAVAPPPPPAAQPAPSPSKKRPKRPSSVVVRASSARYRCRSPGSLRSSGGWHRELTIREESSWAIESWPVAARPAPRAGRRGLAPRKPPPRRPLQPQHAHASRHRPV